MIIPAHRTRERDGRGREPDPAPLLEAKRRSVHNNYLTLPVLFTMLAGHFAFTFGADEAWFVLVLVFVLTAGIRHFFNLWHVGRRAWWIPAGAAVAAILLAFWLQPDVAPPEAGPVPFAQVQPVIEERCATCHSGTSAPLGVRLETEAEITARAEDIERQACRPRRCRRGTRRG